jgi:soluble lytic murein transglycosylase-like protein
MLGLAGCGIALMAATAAGQESADASDDAALVARALAYEHGEGMPQDRLKAAALYCAAARHGNAEAQFSLGWMYANGRGVVHDEGAAAALFTLSAEQGHAGSRQALRFVAADAATALPDCMLPEEPAALAATEPPDPFSALPPDKQKIADVVIALAPEYAVAPRLALAVISVESNFDPNARSRKDARGLMQLVPDTATRFRVRDAFDIRDNVRGGLRYLRWLLSYYRGRVALAAAAYNAGESVVDRYRGIPPYPETESYVQRVLALFGKEQHPYEAGLAAPPAFVQRP